MQRRMKLRKKLSCLQLHRCARAIGNSLELRHSEGPGNDPKWPHRRNASPPLRTNSHRATTRDCATIQNGHRATMCTNLCTKFAPHHGKPRYDPKWPPRHNASPLCAQNSHHATTMDRATIQNDHRAATPAHFVHKIRTATKGDHVTIQNCDRTTRAHSVITSSSRKENNLFLNFLNARSTLRLQVFLQPRGTF